MKKSTQTLSLKQRRINKSLADGRLITQRDVAEAVGVGRQVVNRWEMGYPITRFDDAVKLAEFYGCSIDEMVGHKVSTTKPA